MRKIEVGFFSVITRLFIQYLKKHSATVRLQEEAFERISSNHRATVASIIRKALFEERCKCAANLFSHIQARPRVPASMLRHSADY